MFLSMNQWVEDTGVIWIWRNNAQYVSFKPPWLTRKHKKPKLHNGPEPCHVVALLCHECGKSQFCIRGGGGNATRNRHTRKQDSSISTNTIKRDKTHSLSLLCPFAQRPPVDVHCTLITVARPVCIVLRCSHEDGWSQAGSKGKCEALVIVYRHEWMANGNDIDIASSCHHASSSLIERHLERLKRLCICNETLRRESKFAEVAHCWSELESKWLRPWC